jgi:hypothetical protein
LGEKPITFYGAMTDRVKFINDRLGLRNLVGSHTSDGCLVFARGSWSNNHSAKNGFVQLNNLETLYLIEKSSFCLDSHKPLSLQEIYNLKWNLDYPTFKELKRSGFSKKKLQSLSITTVNSKDEIQIKNQTGKIGIVDGSDISFISLDLVHDPL